MSYGHGYLSTKILWIQLSYIIVLLSNFHLRFLPDHSEKTKNCSCMCACTSFCFQLMVPCMETVSLGLQTISDLQSAQIQYYFFNKKQTLSYKSWKLILICWSFKEFRIRLSVSGKEESKYLHSHVLCKAAQDFRLLMDCPKCLPHTVSWATSAETILHQEIQNGV